MASNNILIDQQQGFRLRLSCEIQRISAVNDWAKCINFCSQPDAILLEFSKAFDSVPHQRLLLKLDYYGICGKTASRRLLKQSLPSGVCEWQPLQSSARTFWCTPRLSIRTSFLLYINDITEHIQSTMRLFADDSII